MKHVSNPHAKEFLDKAPRSPKTTDDQSLKAQPIQTSSKKHVAKAPKQTLQKPLAQNSNELSLETYDNVTTKSFETISSLGSKPQPSQTIGTPRTKVRSSSKKDNSFSSNQTETIVPPKPVLSEEKKASEAQTKTKPESPTEQSLDESSETLKPLGDKIKAHKVKKILEKYQSEESLQSDSVQFKGQPKKVAQAMENSPVDAVDNSTVHAVMDSAVQSEENSAIEAKGNSTGQSVENLTLQALGNSTVQSVENTAVQEKENSTVQSVENSAVQEKENATVQSVDNSAVQAKENSTVQSVENTAVQEKENSTEQSAENSAVQVKGNSTVVLKDNSTVQPKSETISAHYKAKLTKGDNFVLQTDKPVTNSSKDLSTNVNKDSVQPLPEQYIKNVNIDLRQSSTGFFSSIRNSLKGMFRK